MSEQNEGRKKEYWCGRNGRKVRGREDKEIVIKKIKASIQSGVCVNRMKEERKNIDDA